MACSLAVLLTLCIALSAVSSRSITMMASKYLGKSPVFVAGGSNGVGLEIVKQLTQLGTPVHALVRREESKTLLETFQGVTVTLGDANDESAIQKCMEGCIAAITTLGGNKPADGSQRIDYIGNSNVIEQAGILGVERIILVTSVGCGASRGAVSEQVYKVLEDFLVAKTKAERDLKTYTNLDWTIVRPGGLKSDAATGNAILTGDMMASGVINRQDVATLVVRALGSTTCTRKELTAIDPSIVSAYGGDSASLPLAHEC